MHLRLTGCGALSVASLPRIGRAVMPGLPREGVHARCGVRPARSVGDSAENSPRTIPRGAVELAFYVVEFSAVTTLSLALQSCRGSLHVCVTKCAGPPSNLRSGSHPDFWRPDPGQLPMNKVSYEKGILPRMQRNTSSRLITTASAAAQRHAVNGPLRGTF